MSEDNKTNGNPEDLLPDWMVNLFKPGNRLCHKCEKDLTLDELVGVELFCSSFGDGMNKGPRAALDTLCPHCGRTIRFILNVDLTELLQGVAGFYEYVAQYRMEPNPPSPKLPSPNTDPPAPPEPDPEIPLCDIDETDDGESDEYPRWVKTDRFGAIFNNGGEKENSIERRFRFLQMHKKHDRKKLMTDEEVKAFLKKMTKSSSKRSTKSFREFFAKLGIDIDKNYDVEGGDQ